MPPTTGAWAATARAHGLLESCREHVLQVAARHDRKVSLVGWSLGGVYARELAKQLEPQTRCVITLGSPFSGHVRATNAARAYELYSGQPLQHDPVRAERLRRAPSVPTTSIYSKTDGVVAWQCSLNEDAPHTENIEIHASHLGLGVNPLALYAVADRLRQDPAALAALRCPGRAALAVPRRSAASLQGEHTDADHRQRPADRGRHPGPANTASRSC